MRPEETSKRRGIKLTNVDLPLPEYPLSALSAESHADANMAFSASFLANNCK